MSDRSSVDRVAQVKELTLVDVRAVSADLVCTAGLHNVDNVCINQVSALNVMLSTTSLRMLEDRL